MSALATWLDRHTRHAPAALAERTRAYAWDAVPSETSARPEQGSSQAAVPAILADGARRALVRALAQPEDRSAALDLLAGDALVTLALLAQAEAAPERLGDFARALLRSDRLGT